MHDQKSLAENAATTPETSEAKAPSAIQTSNTSSDAGPVKAQEKTHSKDYRQLIPLAIFALAAFLFFCISSFWTSWQNSISVTTDDAYVRADVAPLSTRAHGIVLKTLVKDYEKVVPGQVLIELRNEDFKDRVNEAEQTVSQA